MDWPPQSPCLNPIGAVWAYLDQEKVKLAPSNANELRLFTKGMEQYVIESDTEILP